jgi:hypothetical protein
MISNCLQTKICRSTNNKNNISDKLIFFRLDQTERAMVSNAKIVTFLLCCECNMYTYIHDLSCL